MSDNTDPTQEELNKLKETNQNLENENKILKKALEDIYKLADDVLKPKPSKGLFSRENMEGAST